MFQKVKRLGRTIRKVSISQKAKVWQILLRNQNQFPVLWHIVRQNPGLSQRQAAQAEVRVSAKEHRIRPEQTVLPLNQPRRVLRRIKLEHKLQDKAAAHPLQTEQIRAKGLMEAPVGIPVLQADRPAVSAEASLS